MPLKIALVQVVDFEKLYYVLYNTIGNLADGPAPEAKGFVETIKRSQKPIYSPYPLGILALAAYARERFGKKVEISVIDMLQQRITSEELLDRLDGLSPDIVGLSGFSFYADEIHKVAGLIKKKDKRCIVALGGPYASASTKRAAGDKNVDIVAFGEGELSFEEIIKRALKKKRLSGIDGTALRIGKKVIVNPQMKFIESIDALPFPAVDLIDVMGYSGQPPPVFRYFGVPWMLTFNSRGCPYKCAYCHNIFGKRTRFMSVKRTFDELVHYYKRYGIREFHVWDDIFNLDVQRGIELSRKIAALKADLRFYYMGGLRADIMKKELLDAMIKAGACYVFYAVESGSPRIQKLISKNLDLKKAAEAINFTADAGVLTNTYNMMGFPTETRGEMQMTVDYNLKLRHHSMQMFKVIPQEGTLLYDMVEAGRRSATGTTDMYTEYTSTVGAGVTPREFETMVRKGFRDFYLDPKRIRRVLKMRSPILSREEICATYNVYLRMLKAGDISTASDEAKRELKKLKKFEP